MLVPSPGATGSNFGIGYIAEKEKKKAFVKAIDFVGALKSADPMRELSALTSRANFEREVLQFCVDQRLSKVVQLLGHEYINNDPTMNVLNQVACLVLEFGDGDLRSRVTGVPATNDSWKLHVLRDIALAIEQLHRHGVAHQDIKPSNVISMPHSVRSTGCDMKLGDLGRVVRKGVSGPFDSLSWPGDYNYSPPERWYGFRPGNWTDEREAADLFMLGSLVFFLFAGTPVQPLLLASIPMNFRPENWRGGYDDTLISVLRRAQAQVLQGALYPKLSSEISDAVISLARDLTEPDPKKRGDPQARRLSGSPVGTDRFHQRFRMLAIRAEITERVGKA